MKTVMKRLVSILVVAALAVAAYAYFAPRMAFNSTLNAIASQDLRAFIETIDLAKIRQNLRHDFSFEMVKAAQAYPNIPDLAVAETAFSKRFDERSTALTSPAIALAQLSNQLKGHTDFSFKYSGLNNLNVIWTNADGEQHVSLSRSGILWRVSAIEFPEHMPAYWERPIQLVGKFHRGNFENCCVAGLSKITPYASLTLIKPMDVLDIFTPFDDSFNADGVSQVQLSGPLSRYDEIQNNQTITVKCGNLVLGLTGHYALPVYCEQADRG
jgi:hypothetical protein